MSQEVTFEQLPKLVSELQLKLERIENLLLRLTHPQEANHDDWFDLNGLRQYLPDRPAKSTVYGWVHRTMIPFHKKAKKIYFLKSEIDQWLKAGRKKTLMEIAVEARAYLSSTKKNGKGQFHKSQ